MRAFIGLLVLAGTIALPVASLAQAPADMLARIGMLGRWSNDCAFAAASKNDLYYYTFERVSSGTGAQLRMGSIVRMIDNVRQPTSNTIAFRLTTLPGASEYLRSEQVIEVQGNRYRTISSVAHDGKVHIRNGINATSGAATVWSYRCP